MRLTENECWARFAGSRVARLATVAEDGSPRLVPITFVVVGELGAPAVIFSAVDHKPKSTADLARLRRIEREPRVSLLADRYAEDWAQLWWVRADAYAEVLTAGTEHETGIAALRRKYEQYGPQPPGDALIRFVVREWSGWAASAEPRT
ncbi:MAG: TIGR03668 family PPOX class F420-dependent oxidoreductase [Actinomycetota bacterium]|nr:TIGR03668 family PPOX class F420-dependent oxidoreductase [Actinomycetota bacterium]